GHGEQPAAISSAVPLQRSRVLPPMAAMVPRAPLAYASPPDPGWIAGFWDNGDYDDVVLLATSSVGTTDGHLPWHTKSAVVVIASVSAPDESLLSACPLSSWHTRAPPAASA